MCIRDRQRPPGGARDAGVFTAAPAGGGYLLRLQGCLPLGLSRLHVGRAPGPVSYTHLRAHETSAHL
eukprot:1572447-Alexandrium_andersonii.AAC.1